MSHNGKYYNKSVKRNTINQRSLFDCGVKKQKCDDETIIAPEVSIPPINVPSSSTSEVSPASSSDCVVSVAVPSTSKPEVSVSAVSANDVSQQPGSSDTAVTVIPMDVITDDDTGHESSTSQAPSDSQNDTIDSNKNDDCKADIHDARKRCNIQYENRFSWCYHSSKRKGYICKFCELFGANLTNETAFVSTGAILGSHPTRRLEGHENSNRHKLSTDRYAALAANTDAVKMLLKTSSQKFENKAKLKIEQNRNYIKKLLKVTVFLVKHKWGHCENLKEIAKLLTSLGDKEVGEMLSSDTNYLSPRSATEFVETVSAFYEQKALDDLNNKKFTLFLDESTDNANRSQVSVMARWVGEAGVKENFLGLVNMTGTKASDFEEAVQSFCLSKNLDPRNIRFVALDGCNTMSGEKTGLQKRVRHMSPLSLYINCRNHRLALCFTHLLKKNEIMADVEALLVSIWKVFHFSAKRHAVFRQMQELYDETPLTFIRAAATRWLSHLRASKRFISRYESLLDTLDTILAETREPEIAGIRARAADRQTVFTILLLTDVLKPVNYLSLYLQSDVGYFSSLAERVKVCINELHGLIQQYEQGQFADDLEFRKCEAILDIIRDRTDLARRLRDDNHQLTPMHYLQTVGIPMIYQLITEIEDAFTVKSGVLAAFSVLDPVNLPDTANDLCDYGKEKIKTLAQHYGHHKTDTFQGHVSVAPPDVDAVVEQELLAFRTHLFLMKKRPQEPVTRLSGVYEELQKDEGLNTCFPRVQSMYELAMLIPQSTAVVERSFSAMNDICTHLRTSLTTKHLCDLMRVNLLDISPNDIELNSLVDKFKSLKQRDMEL